MSELLGQGVDGRSQGSNHHFVAERYFGRSANRPGTVRDQVFSECPWGVEGKTRIFCYDCHEVVFHNPVLLPGDIDRLVTLMQSRGLREEKKSDDLGRVAQIVKLMHDVIDAGLTALLDVEEKGRLAAAYPPTPPSGSVDSRR